MSGSRAKKTVEKGIVLFKYSMPSISVVLSWIFCTLKVWRLSNDETVRVTQSVFGLAESVKKASEKTLASGSTEQVDIGLAKSLLPSVTVLWVTLAVLSFLALWQLVFTIAAFSKPATSDEANRVKVWFSMLYPTKLLQLIIPLLAVIPQILPLYVVNRFEEYYRVSGIDGTTATYYDYSATAVGFNPFVASVLIAAFSVVIFFATYGLERKHKLDMYVKFEPEAPARVPVRHRRKDDDDE